MAHGNSVFVEQAPETVSPVSFLLACVTQTFNFPYVGVPTIGVYSVIHRDYPAKLRAERRTAFVSRIELLLVQFYGLLLWFGIAAFPRIEKFLVPPNLSVSKSGQDHFL